MSCPDAEPPAPEPEYADALPAGLGRGRGAGLNPANRFEGQRLHVLGEHLDTIHAEGEDGRQYATQVGRDTSRSILNYVDPEKSPDIGFRWTINPYRGCSHGCIYCYARPTHEYLGLSSGLDFETRLLAKYDAPRLLREALADPKWHGEPIVMSGVTDPYQPVERELRITRGCLAVLAECRQPVSLITKSRLVLRDLDLLGELAAHRAVSVGISITTLENRLAGQMEPRASSPSDRLAAVRRLSEAGVPVTVMVAPIVPGLTDREIPRILEAAAEAGARGAGHVMLRLPHQVKAVFLDWLKREYPERAGRVESLVRASRGGKLYDARPGRRMRGEGAMAEQVHDVFRVFARRLGLVGRDRDFALSRAAFRRPLVGGDGQMSLFQ